MGTGGSERGTNGGSHREEGVGSGGGWGGRFLEELPGR